MNSDGRELLELADYICTGRVTGDIHAPFSYSRIVAQCFTKHLQGSSGAAVKLHLIIQNITSIWANEVAFMESSYKALQWIRALFGSGGANCDKRVWT